MTSASLRRILYWASNFALPVLLFVAVTASSGVYPFADQSFLSEDLKFQYIDFFAWHQSVLGGDGSLFYSGSQALGGNMWGLYSYYLASPFNLLVVFFGDDLAMFVWATTALKLGCIQLAMAAFLRRRFGLGNLACILLALCYTFSSWTATQVRNPMWLDVLIWLPLACWGVYALVREGRWRLLLASAVLAIFACWYTGYMLVVFAFFYLLFEMYIAKVGRRGWRLLARFAGVMLLALALCAFTFLPTVLAMMQDISPQLQASGVQDERSVSALVESVLAGRMGLVAALVAAAIVAVAAFAFVSVTRSIGDRAKLGIQAGMIAAFFLVLIVVSTMLHITNGGLDVLLDGFWAFGWELGGKEPQLFCGTVALILALALFFLPGVSGRLKLACMTMLLFMVASSWSYALYVPWCGFKTPGGFYCRISFLFAFCLVWTAACCLKECKEQPWGESALSRLGHAGSGIVMSVVLALTFVELGASAVHDWDQIYIGYSQSGNDEHVSHSKELLSRIEAQDEGPYRMEKTYGRAGYPSLNEGMAIGYMQLSSYSSAHDENAIAFLCALGYSHEGELSMRYASPILASDSLLGVRYVDTSLDAYGFEAVSKGDGDGDDDGPTLYRNPYALGLGYLVSDDSESIDFSGTDDPFQRQNILVDALYGDAMGAYSECESVVITQEEASRTYKVSVPSGCIAYTYVVGAGSSKCSISVDGGEAFGENSRWQDCIYGISGASEEERSVNVRLDVPDGLTEDAHLVFYALDLGRFFQVVDGLAAGEAQFAKFEDGDIEADVDSGRGGLLMLSVPNADGWDVEVNGIKAATVDIAGGALMGIPVMAGANHVSMSFTPPGLLPGCVVSIVALVLLVIILVLPRRFALHGTRVP